MVYIDKGWVQMPEIEWTWQQSKNQMIGGVKGFLVGAVVAAVAEIVLIMWLVVGGLS